MACVVRSEGENTFIKASMAVFGLAGAGNGGFG
jgi:hypothetical protein